MTNFSKIKYLFIFFCMAISNSSIAEGIKNNDNPYDPVFADKNVIDGTRVQGTLNAQLARVINIAIEDFLKTNSLSLENYMVNIMLKDNKYRVVFFILRTSENKRRVGGAFEYIIDQKDLFIISKKGYR